MPGSDESPAVPSGANSLTGASPAFVRVPAPVVSVVMCAKDEAAMTLNALRALRTRTPEGLMQVILVDDGSRPEARAVFAALHGVDLVRHEESVGFLHSSNRGLRVARGEFVVFLNNDTEVQPNWLPPLLAAMEDPTVGAVGSRLINPDHTVQEAGVTLWSDGTGHARGSGAGVADDEWLSTAEVDFCSGAALMVRRALVNAIGGFDLRYVPAFYEDADLCFAVRARGFRVLVAPASTVLHHGGQSYGAVPADGSPIPPGRLGQFRNEPVFWARWWRTLSHDHLPPGSRAGLVPFRARDRPRILIVDAWIPAHDRDAGGLRMTWIARLLHRMGVDVTLWALGGPSRAGYAAAFRQEGIEVWHGDAGHTFVESRAGLWDLVMVSRPDVGIAVLATIRKWCPRAPLLYDTVDVHHVRMAREAEVSGEPAQNFGTIRFYEEQMCAAADAIVTVSDTDANHLRPLFPAASFITLPVVQPTWPTEPPPAGGRAGLLFIGGYQHVPNQDACRWFTNDVWPLMGSHDMPVTFLGDGPPDDLIALAGSHGFTVPGFRDDVTPDFNAARVFICPLRFGSGVKGKVCNALAAGLPIVATSISVEGMDLEAGRDVLVADDPSSFAAAVDALSHDDDLWARVSAAGLTRASAWSPEAMEGKLHALLGDLLPPRQYRSLSPRSRSAP